MDYMIRNNWNYGFFINALLLVTDFDITYDYDQFGYAFVGLKWRCYSKAKRDNSRHWISEELLAKKIGEPETLHNNFRDIILTKSWEAKSSC